jgi:hypothetical protein
VREHEPPGSSPVIGISRRPSDIWPSAGPRRETRDGEALNARSLGANLDALKEANRIQAAESVKAIDRIYDQSMWFIGLTITMALSVIGLAVSTFLQTKGGSK